MNKFVLAILLSVAIGFVACNETEAKSSGSKSPGLFSSKPTLSSLVEEFCELSLESMRILDSVRDPKSPAFDPLREKEAKLNEKVSQLSPEDQKSYENQSIGIGIKVLSGNGCK